MTSKSVIPSDRAGGDGKRAEPSACVIDAQSVKTSTRVPAAGQGTDAAAHPSIRKVWVDGGYRQHLVEHAARLGIDMEIVQRTHGTRGLTPLPKRSTVERTYGRLVLHRGLARDYETLPARSEAMIHLAMTDLMTRRLTGEATISWRAPTPRDPGRFQSQDDLVDVQVTAV